MAVARCRRVGELLRAVCVVRVRQRPVLVKCVSSLQVPAELWWLGNDGNTYVHAAWGPHFCTDMQSGTESASHSIWQLCSGCCQLAKHGAACHMGHALIKKTKTLNLPTSALVLKCTILIRMDERYVGNRCIYHTGYAQKQSFLQLSQLLPKTSQ